MNKIIIFIFIFINLLGYSVYAKDNELDSIFRMLDRVIADNKLFMEIKEQQIADYKRLLTLPNITLEQEYHLNSMLVAEYRPYVSDSAIVYAKNCISLAKNNNEMIWLYESTLNLSFLYSLSLRFIEAHTLLQSIPPQKLPDALRIKYYETCKQLLEYYSHESDFFGVHELYRDSLLMLYPYESEGYKTNIAEILIEKGNIDEGIEILQQLLDINHDDTHWRAMLAYKIGDAYRISKNIENQKKYFAISAIADIKNAVKENASLHALAMICYETGDIERAYKYILQSLDDATFSNAHLRSVEVSQVFPIIENAHREHLAIQQKRLVIMLICICVLSLLMVAAIVYVYTQNIKLKRTRKSLSDANNKLSELNINLQETNTQMEIVNKSLLEANRLKEEYLGRYLDQCSGYLDKLESFRRHLDRIATVGKTEDLYKMIKSKEFLENELKDFYAEFDKTFLLLFPDFIEQFNSLLHEEEKFIPKNKELLNTELRIFALIRLGITDSNKIAHFLRYPVNTIYNYRTKARNKAACERCNFEDNIMKIGVIE